ncbi:hypothetical protein [Aurantiacibacter poecillastricola]|uniref:hypothetical protein n=1 Tax=Aurantiacibacter poecillastricola TaxID=3064385 RepID=UPI00273FB14F|nr:hypothetical protein [Aurantiacibacter sp. 219JJ12-13]MDP5263348.1 hypothetical protein [Aurantiacibacter sp. 219JJ12-13]WBY18103.1 hypothetical protein PF049_13755 [Erythrobacteraceae bacterium WH01K]
MSSPRVLCYGVGIDSTALLVELESRGEAPDLVLTADTGAEKTETYAFQEIMRRWMAERSIAYEVVRYEAKRFKNWPPYRDLTESLLTNGCLPSIAFGRHSCSLKYKAAPQEAFIKAWQPAIEAWAQGKKVIRYIGYDASPRDGQRYAHAKTIDDPLFDNRYPLREWGWDRTACANRIIEAGLPVPPKSSCVFCTAMKPDEVRSLSTEWLRTIVLIEARAAPRLKTVEGLWRKSTRTRPGRMTDFIRDEGLLDSAEIDRIIETAPPDLVAFQERAAQQPLETREPMSSWLDRFHGKETHHA